MRNSMECIVWNTMKGVQLTNGWHYADIKRSGIKPEDKFLFLLFLPWDMEEPAFLKKYNYYRIIQTNMGRYFVADNEKDNCND